jgi:intracellular septation protein A
VSFHAFGTTGLMVVFLVGQVFYLSKHMEPAAASDNPTP